MASVERGGGDAHAHGPGMLMPVGISASAIGEDHLDELAELCVGCSAFFELVEGKPGGREVAQELLSECAPGLGPESKHLVGLRVEGALVGVLDLAEGYPQPGDWYVALFLLTPHTRGRGLGRAVWAAVEGWIRARQGRGVRLVVQHQNPDARRFWESVGFAVVGETDQRLATGVNRVHRLHKPLVTPQWMG